MKLRISRASAIAAAFVAVSARVFLAFAVDFDATHNGVWLSALLGLLPAIPWLMLLDVLSAEQSQMRVPVRVTLSLLLFSATLLDSSAVFATIVRSAGYLALDRVSTLGLSVPVCLAMLWSVSRNGDAVGYGAMLWLRLYPAFLLLVIILQFRQYRPEWLCPVLGKGWADIVRGSAGATGLAVPASAILFLTEARTDKAKRRDRHAAIPAFAFVAAALFLILRLMMTPFQLQGNTWLNRLDALLTNGRAPLYLQLPIIVMWYASLFHLLACESFACAALLQRTLRRLDGRACTAMVALGTTLLALTGVPDLMRHSYAGQWLFMLTALFAVIVALSTLRSKGGAGRCA